MLISIILLLLLLLLKFSLHAKMKNCFSSVPAHHNLVYHGDVKAMEDLTLNPGTSGFSQMEIR